MFEVNRLLLQVAKTKADYNSLQSCIPTEALDKTTKDVLGYIKTYFIEYEAHKAVVADTFLSHVELSGADEDVLLLLRQMLPVIMEEPDEDSRKGLIRQLKTMEFANELDKVNNTYHTGGDVDLFETVEELVQSYKRDIQRDLHTDFVRDSIEDVVEGDASGISLRWRHDQLHGSMPGLKTGMQIIFAARPGKGKTSFMANNAAFFCHQIPDGRPVVWFNNEGKGREIYNTCYRAALALSNVGIKKYGFKKAAEKYASILGHKDRIRIFDIHGRDYRYLERIIQNHSPGVVIFDMLDNVKGFGDAARPDLRLEELYKWARDCSVIYDFLSLPTSQLSVEAEGERWPDQSMLKDSKTAKQGACDAVITMGAVNKPQLLHSRYLHIPKAFKGTPLPGHKEDCLAEVLFKPETAQFT